MYVNWNMEFGMSLFILFFEKRSWLTEWIVDLDASQNNSGTQQNQEQIGKYASFPQEIQVTRYSCCHRDSVSDSDQLRITLLDFFLVLQLVVEGCRFIVTYRGGRLAMLMMTWMILATILSKKKPSKQKAILTLDSYQRQNLSKKGHLIIL